MSVITDSWILDLWLLISILIGGIYIFYWYQFQFWRKRNVPHTKPIFFFGDMKKATSITLGLIFKELYHKFKGYSFFGAWIFFKPTIVIRDLDLIKRIMVKDFMSFHDKGIYYNKKEDPFSGHLTAMKGKKWRNLRTKFTPTFTSGKMKMMFPIFQECSEELKELLKEPAGRGEIVEMKEIAGRFTTDVVSLFAFGIHTNSLKNPDAIIRKMGRKIFTISNVKYTKDIIKFFIPKLGALIGMLSTPKDVEKFFFGVFKEVMDSREEKNIKRNDFMQLCIQLKNKGKLEDVNDGLAKNGKSEDIKEFTFLEAASQAFVFFRAGFETTSTTIQFALYELSLHQDIQEKVRNEILKVLEKHDGKITYEAIYEMDYLGRVIDETLRKYPPVPILRRECTKDFQIPGTQVVISTGVLVTIPILGIQMDPEYFPNPERFDPDRFTEEEKSKRHHYAYLPFGEGPRNCIAMRFALMQILVGLATILSKYRFEISKDTQVPMVLDRKSYILSPEKMMNLKISMINEN